MKINWLKPARQDLEQINTYIAKESPRVAIKILKKIRHTVELLHDQPNIGRPGRVPHTKELIISETPFIVPYRVKNHVLEILRVLHSAMEWADIPIGNQNARFERGDREQLKICD